MNRHERRKQRALQRKGGDTMGASYSARPLPPSITNHPTYRSGLKAAQEGKGFPPEYYEEVERAAELIFNWVKAEPQKPDLRWVEQKDDGTFIAAALDVGAQYLADSPDAFRLLAWLDEKTGRRLSLNQAMWALRRCRAMRMPDGSYWGVETKMSPGMRQILAFTEQFGNEANRVPPAPCGHCGRVNEAASHAEGKRAGEGDYAVCFQCLGLNRFDAELRMVAVGAEEYEALPADFRAELEDMQSLLRAARLKAPQKDVQA